MTIDLYELLKQSPSMVFFLAISLGYLVGKIRYKQFELGSTAGVLLVSLVLGHFGFTGPAGVQEIGFILFIYSVGMVAGPRFFSVMLENGLRYILLALVTATVAFFLSKFFVNIFDFEYGFGAGLMAGALTSTPTLAAAQDVVMNGLVAVPEGITPEDASNNVTEGRGCLFMNVCWVDNK